MLKKIYKRDGPLRAAFKVKTLAVLFPPYPRQMKTNTAKFESAAILALPTRALSHARGLSMRTHLTAVDDCLGLEIELREKETISQIKVFDKQTRVNGPDKIDV